MLNLFEVVLPLVGVGLLIAPLYFIASNKGNAKQLKSRMVGQICVFFGAFALIVVFQINSFVVFAETATTTGIQGTMAQGLGFIAAALVTFGSTIGAGIAVSSAASAAIGAISENEENFGKAIIFVALAEGVAIYGLLISILIINKL